MLLIVQLPIVLCGVDVIWSVSEVVSGLEKTNSTNNEWKERIGRDGKRANKNPFTQWNSMKCNFYNSIEIIFLRVFINEFESKIKLNSEYKSFICSNAH